MSGVIHLRSYQTEAIRSLFCSWREGMRRPAVVLPTGSGKTVIFSHVVRDFHAKQSGPLDVLKVRPQTGFRSLILVHRDELADQALDKIHQTAPDLFAGKIKAEWDDYNADVMVASVQTLSRDARLRRVLDAQSEFGDIGLIITDECHHAPAPSYRKIYDALPDAVNAGFSATLIRGDGVGLGSVWDDVVYDRSVLWMISRGFLVDVRGQRVRLDQLELSKVKKSAGDFQAKALGSAMVAADSPRVIAAALRRYAPNRRSIVFCPDVFSAVATASAIGPSAAVVTGGTPREDRRLIYKQFETGELRVIVSCMVLTEGFDAPWADCAVIARPTKSPALYQQMVGRVLRTWPGKDDALVIDVTGTGGRLSTLIDLAPGEVDTVRSGETLAQAAIRYETDQDTIYDADSVAFALKHRDLDLFTGSSKSWLRTDGGVLFLPVGAGFVFLWPAGDGRWDVGAAPARGKWKRLHTSLPLGTAQAWAETEADELTAYKSRNADKSNTWRKEPATGPMIGRAVRYGFRVEPGATRGEVSDLIAIGEASQKLDPYMKQVKV
jgi:superfamily II DNA or RNA helicase